MGSRLGLAFAIAVIVLAATAAFGYMMREAIDGEDAPAQAEAGSGVADALAEATDAFAPWQGWTEAFVALEDRCLRVIVADEADERVQGLRAVTDLEPYDGMLFVFDEDGDAQFTMADTLIALDIGWYDAAGAPIDRTTMQPCPEAELDCPPYAARGKYRYALETEAGTGGAGILGACSA